MCIAISETPFTDKEKLCLHMFKFNAMPGKKLSK